MNRLTVAPHRRGKPLPYGLNRDSSSGRRFYDRLEWRVSPLETHPLTLELPLCQIFTFTARNFYQIKAHHPHRNDLEQRNRGAAGGFQVAPLEAAAKALGMTATALEAQFRAGLGTRDSPRKTLSKPLKTSS